MKTGTLKISWSWIKKGVLLGYSRGTEPGAGLKAENPGIESYTDIYVFKIRIRFNKY